MSFPACRRGSGARQAVLVALVLLPIGALGADYLPLAGRIGVVASRVESQLARNARCTARAPVLEQRILELQHDPVANAEAIADTETRIVTVRACIEDSRARSASLELQLAGLASQFVSGTQADPADLQQRISVLRTQEASHAQLKASLDRARQRLEQLQQNPDADAVRIAQKTAVIASIGAELETLLAVIADANNELADLERELLAAHRTGSASLSWSIPTTRANGSPLPTGELGGYEIYVLSESTGASTIITLGDPLVTRYTVEGLEPDTYHFSIAAYDTTGKVSELSTIVTKTVL